MPAASSEVSRRLVLTGLSALSVRPGLVGAARPDTMLAGRHELIRARRKVALVIGNTAYQHNTQILSAVADAAEVGRQLAALGFEVTPETTNLSHDALRRSVAAFGQRIRALGPDTVSFVYYNGHAAQDPDGVNYLMPVDSVIDTPAQMRVTAIPVQSLLADMEAAENDVNILVLDACRDWFEDSRPGVRQGLADMGVHASVLIAYAVGPGTKAPEPRDRSSSPYSAQLIKALRTSYTDTLTQLFDDVQTSVFNDMGGMQSPIYLNGLSRLRRWGLTSGLPPVDGEAAQPKPADRLGFVISDVDRPALMRFTRGAKSFVDALIARTDLLARERVNTLDRVAFLLGFVAYETGAFHSQIERFGYDATGLMRIFTRTVPTMEVADRYAGRPEAAANHVYAGFDGNGDEASGDGWKYRGRGLLMIVGKNKYERFGRTIGVDLLASPELANDPEIGLAIATRLWGVSGANEAADTRAYELVTKRLKLKPHNWDKRLWWLRAAYRALHAEVPADLA